MNAEEFKQQYYPFHSKLYRVAYAILNNAEDAEDILQDAYCKLWIRRDELAGIQRPEAFCVTLIKNLCMDFLKSPGNQMSCDLTETIFIEAETRPDEEFESKEKLRQIERLIDKLPEKQRLVIQMRAYGDCSLEEIEAATGESAANVRVLLSRARKTLRDMLPKYQTDKTKKNGYRTVIEEIL
ncbi:MAG: sigma-70 family RNA polymerase sigma factor [Tannerella sp.]|jgi:RNA polymerase sigma-70 factor (ECF subfamily)|nr:sigma-70 family RNA polymerase sigma factor [Tannerella sp.]